MAFRGGTVRQVARIAALIVGLLTLTGCKQEVHFTKTPATGPSPPAAMRRETATVFLGIPVSFSAVEAVAETAIPQDLGRIVEWIDDAACAKRTRWVECNSARVDATAQRNGPVTFEIVNGRPSLKIPLKYQYSARGLGWARDISEAKSGQLVATLSFDAGLSPQFEPEARTRDDLAFDQSAIPVLKGKFPIGRHFGPRLRKAISPVADALKKAISEQGVRDMTERSWRALATPVELAREPQLWLRSEPEKIAAGGFASEGNQILYRIAMTTRITIQRGARPAPPLPRRLPELVRTMPAETRTKIRLPVIIPSEPMVAAVRKAFPAQEILKTDDGPGTTPIGVKVRQISLYPARGQLGIEIELDVVEPRQWFGLIGTAHFVGRPVVRGDTGLLELEAVEFPDQKQRNAAAQRPKSRTSENQQKTLRIGAEPFAGRLSRSARLDMRNVLRDILPHANGLLGQPLTDGFSLSGRFDEVVIGDIEPARDGFEIGFEITGHLLLRHEPPRAPDAPQN